MHKEIIKKIFKTPHDFDVKNRELVLCYEQKSYIINCTRCKKSIFIHIKDSIHDLPESMLIGCIPNT